MESLFLAFANRQSDPLPTLREEDDKACSLLSRRAGQGHYALHRDSYASLPKVAEQLLNYRDSLVAFLFSGHAGRDWLLLEDQSARAEGIAELLGLCPCPARRLALPNHPAVIATSAPVPRPAGGLFHHSLRSCPGGCGGSA